MGAGVICIKGSTNQCVANPLLCSNKEYCVELEDKDMTWEAMQEKEGYGYACIKKNIFEQVKILTPYCNFYRSKHNMKTKPINGLDYCCYQHLICSNKNKEPGGYLFKNRPCYCIPQFRKCLIKQKAIRKVKNIADGLLPIVGSIRVCSMDETGQCDPRRKESCQKGDLIDPNVAHCRVNCRTGPLLPIEIRSCRIRRCSPQNNLRAQRVIDVPYYRESSRCDAVDKLPVKCGFKNTRCVCDGKPSYTHFTDRCRCQYW